MARFIADQRTMYRGPHALTGVILGLSVSWFCSWVHREPTPTEVRRATRRRGQGRIRGVERTYGSPRVHADLVEAGWTVCVNTVADSMRRQGLRVGSRSPAKEQPGRTRPRRSSRIG